LIVFSTSQIPKASINLGSTGLYAGGGISPIVRTESALAICRGTGLPPLPPLPLLYPERPETVEFTGETGLYEAGCTTACPGAGRSVTCRASTVVREPADG
jgi:hypothetical protein